MTSSPAYPCHSWPRIKIPKIHIGSIVAGNVNLSPPGNVNRWSTMKRQGTILTFSGLQTLYDVQVYVHIKVTEVGCDKFSVRPHNPPGRSLQPTRRDVPWLKYDHDFSLKGTAGDSGESASLTCWIEIRVSMVWILRESIRAGCWCCVSVNRWGLQMNKVYYRRFDSDNWRYEIAVSLRFEYPCLVFVPISGQKMCLMSYVIRSSRFLVFWFVLGKVVSKIRFTWTGTVQYRSDFVVFVWILLFLSSFPDSAAEH